MIVEWSDNNKSINTKQMKNEQLQSQVHNTHTTLATGRLFWFCSTVCAVSTYAHSASNNFIMAHLVREGPPCGWGQRRWVTQPKIIIIIIIALSGTFLNYLCVLPPLPLPFRPKRHLWASIRTKNLRCLVLVVFSKWLIYGTNKSYVSILNGGN